jgi:lycopene cyclase domain-containing protein
MTYAQVLLVFIVPPIVILALMLGRTTKKRMWLLLGILVFVAVAYTTPWDNYLVASGVWWYDLELVTGITIGWVPIEEYAFFIVQTVMTGLFYLYLRRGYEEMSFAQSGSIVRMIAFIGTALTWLGSGMLLISGWVPGTYLGLILIWALIPIALQVAFGGDLLLKDWRLVSAAILFPTVYLGFVDWLAIGFGTWTISEIKTTGLMIAGRLPIEEFIFFLVTNILVVFGLHLGLHPVSLVRLQKFLKIFK